MTWTSVKDGLPETHASVIICLHGAVATGTAWVIRRNGEIFWEDAFAFGLQGITHWMPLPQPPSESSEPEGSGVTSNGIAWGNHPGLCECKLKEQNKV